MRLDELFKNLGYIAGTIGAQMREAREGVLLEELDLTGPPPGKVSLRGPAQLVLSEGDTFTIEIDAATPGDEPRFLLENERLSVSGNGVVHVTMPAPRKISVGGPGWITAARLARDGKVSIAGSGRLELAAVEGGHLKVSIAGSGRAAIDGRAEHLELSIAGSGSCDAEGLLVDSAAVHVAGSGDAIFACNGEVEALLMGSGNVIVRGSARCNVRAVGSGTVTCERARESAD